MTVLIALGAYLLKDRLFLIEVQNYIKWLIYILLLGAPVIYLLILGGAQQKDNYEALFEEAGFVGKDGKVPKFVKESFTVTINFGGRN